MKNMVDRTWSAFEHFVLFHRVTAAKKKRKTRAIGEFRMGYNGQLRLELARAQSSLIIVSPAHRYIGSYALITHFSSALQKATDV